MRREQDVLYPPVGGMEVTKIRWFYGEDERVNVIDMIKAEFGDDVPLEMIYGGVMVVLFRKVAHVEEQKRKRK